MSREASLARGYDMMRTGRRKVGMLVTERTREILASRREARKMKALGYRLHETDWELHRGYMWRRKIIDAKISVCGKYVWTLIGPEPE